MIDAHEVLQFHVSVNVGHVQHCTPDLQTSPLRQSPNTQLNNAATKYSTQYPAKQPPVLRSILMVHNLV